VRTGQYRWHFQEVHHDIWDYDAPSPVVLFDLVTAGETRKAIAQAGKTGWVYILDRTNGRPIVGIEERPVPQEPRQATAATQPYPIGDAIVPQSVDIAPIGFTLVNQGRIFTPFVGDKGLIATPGVQGGVNWPPSSYDPVRQTLFVCANDRVGKFIGGDRDFEIPAPGRRYEGGVPAFADLPATGIFAAMDLRTNRIVWRNRWRDRCWAGSVATAGGLVFVGRNDGRLMSLDADTGLPLWEFQTGAGMNATSSVFEHNGNPYVVALSAGNALVGTAHGDSVWLFGLQGTLKETTPGDTVVAAAAPESTTAVAPADLRRGAEVYRRTCVACHGDNGAGGHGGPSLNRVHDVFVAVRTITDGRGEMPPFKVSLTAQQILDVGSYVAQTFGR
jgi:alcohol dehydrogenase (cytochrome c)